MKSLIRVVHGREALPVRAIPYVAGRFFLPPDEVVKQLARKIAPPFARLQTTTAFHVAGGEVVYVLPREWDDAVASSEALESNLKRIHSSDEEGYAAWIEESKRLLPAAVFVWRENFEKDFLGDIKKISRKQIRKGDDTLNYCPRLSKQEQEWVLDGVFQITQAIDWEYWQQVGLVRAWEAVALSCGINPQDNDLDVDDLVNNHPEVRKRLRLLLNEIGNSDCFSPVVLDGKNTAVILAEFVAWWTIEHYPLSPQLHRIGEPIVFARQETEKRRKGRYTIQEAAELLERDAGEKATAMEKKLVSAVRCGELPTHDPGQNARKEYDGDKPVVRTFVEEVYWDALNAWLIDHETRISYRFPDPTESENEEVEIEAAFTEVTYNDHAINWRYWVQHMPALTAAEAARLMSALDPDVFESLDNRPNHNDPSKAAFKAKRIQRLAEKIRMEEAAPDEWLAWADEHKFAVHKGFRTAVGQICSSAKELGQAVLDAEDASFAPDRKQRAAQGDSTDQPDTSLAELFDPVTIAALEKMFPAKGQWKNWAERASRNELKQARTARRLFNPYKAAHWFLQQGIEGWDVAHINRVLANNLPARSRDEKHRLTGELD